MAAGGTWTVQNKVRPGIYFKFRSKNKQNLTVGDRGKVTICEPMSWGPVGKVMEIAAGEDLTPYTGYDITDAHNRFASMIFSGSNRTAAPTKLLLYRPAAADSAKATGTIAPLTATAKYPGSRGNDIVVIVTALTEPAGSFQISTVVDGVVKDQQTGKTVADLTGNDWVDFSGTGALAANVGTQLSGGKDGEVNSAAYSTYLTNIEPYNFDSMLYDGDETTVKNAMETFIKRVNNELGRFSQLVEANATNPDSRFIVNVCSGLVMNDGTTLTPKEAVWWVGGALSGATYGNDLTNAAVPNAVEISPKMTHNQYVDAINAGKFVFNADDGTVRVEYDINSLVTYTIEIGKVYRYNRTMRLCNTIANDLYKQFAKSYVGIVNNTKAGRRDYKSAIVKYLSDLQSDNGIQNFNGETDVVVEKGEEKDAVLVYLAIEAVGSSNKIYIILDMA